MWEVTALVHPIVASCRRRGSGLSLTVDQYIICKYFVAGRLCARIILNIIEYFATSHSSSSVMAPAVGIRHPLQLNAATRRPLINLLSITSEGTTRDVAVSQCKLQAIKTQISAAL